MKSEVNSPSSGPLPPTNSSQSRDLNSNLKQLVALKHFLMHPYSEKGKLGTASFVCVFAQTF